jgi:BNR repeat-like domain
LIALLLTLRLLSPQPEAPYRQPQLASAPGIVAMTFGAGNAIYFASSTDGGATFSQPVKVGEDGKSPLGRHRGPRIAFAGKTIVISAVVGEKGGGADGDILAYRSTDNGKSWSKGVPVNDARGAAREGLHSMAAGMDGTLFTVWLDLRQKGTRLYGARSGDGGATWSKNVLVYESPDGHICECCHPSVAVDAKGQVYVMWRNWTGGSRDFYLARSGDGKQFGPAEKLGKGTWQLNACPMDGGGLVVDRAGKVFTTWRRQDQVYLAEPGKEEILLGTGKDPAVAMGPNGPYTVWTGAGLQARIPGKSQPVTLDPKGAFVSLTGGDSVVAAWESDGAIVVQALR